MGNASAKQPEIEAIPQPISVVEPNKTEQKKLKPCCACPETKRARDECIIQNGEEKCGDLIEAHKECMRKMGFKI
ncbi:cytochrome c oxidase copper chaperone [Chrysoperla carnea]|uniref:cytochrome c oxidase copper chaperone n=1 Tax=Chrysoperla carnea TaxID=189513 RepID=UPI001D06BC79|nr:cytochrome c oxidase copper chaperone [Chrysoperla carnea]